MAVHLVHSAIIVLFAARAIAQTGLFCISEPCTIRASHDSAPAFYVNANWSTTVQFGSYEVCRVRLNGPVGASSAALQLWNWRDEACRMGMRISVVERQSDTHILVYDKNSLRQCADDVTDSKSEAATRDVREQWRVKLDSSKSEEWSLELEVTVAALTSWSKQTEGSKFGFDLAVTFEKDDDTTEGQQSNGCVSCADKSGGSLGTSRSCIDVTLMCDGFVNCLETEEDELQCNRHLLWRNTSIAKKSTDKGTQRYRVDEKCSFDRGLSSVTEANRKRLSRRKRDDTAGWSDPWSAWLTWYDTWLTWYNWYSVWSIWSAWFNSLSGSSNWSDWSDWSHWYNSWLDWSDWYVATSSWSAWYSAWIAWSNWAWMNWGVTTTSASRQSNSSTTTTIVVSVVVVAFVAIVLATVSTIMWKRRKAMTTRSSQTTQLPRVPAIASGSGYPMQTYTANVPPVNAYAFASTSQVVNAQNPRNIPPNAGFQPYVNGAVALTGDDLASYYNLSPPQYGVAVSEMNVYDELRVNEPPSFEQAVQSPRRNAELPPYEQAILDPDAIASTDVANSVAPVL